MRLLVISDIRTTQELPVDEKVDLVILLGKVPGKKISEIENTFNDVPIIGLLSNSCSPNLYEGTRVVNVHNKIVEFNGFRIAGFGGVPLKDNNSTGYYSEETATEFVQQLKISKADIFVSYSHPAYGDVASSLAPDGFRAYSQIILESLVKSIIHGRLQMDFKRKMGNTDIFSVYPYKIIEIQK